MKKFNLFLIIGLIFIVLSSSVYGALTNNILAYYKLNVNSTNQKDELNKYNATMNGGTFKTTAKINGGYTFQGTTDDMDSNLLVLKNTPQSITMWFNSSNPAQNQYLFANGAGTSANSGFHCYIQDTTRKIKCLITNGLSVFLNDLTTTKTVSTNKWYFLVVTWTGDTSANGFKIYLNGTLINQSTSSGLMSDAIINDYIFGQYSSGAVTEGFKGVLDEISVYNRTLNSTEISELYNNHIGLSYPFITNTQMSSKNYWDNSTITEFNLRAKSPTNDYQFITTNGTIYSNITKSSNELWNLTYYKTGSYFNITYYNVNVSSNHIGYLKQNQVNISIKELFTNNSISNVVISVNGTIKANTTNSWAVIYPKTNTNYIVTVQDKNSIEQYHATSNTFGVTSLQNFTKFVYVHQHYITVMAKNILTNATINTFTVNITSLNTSENRSLNTTTGVLNIPVIHNTYNFTIDATGFALFNNTDQVTITANYSKIFYLYPENTLLINIFDEDTLNRINYTNITITTTSITEPYQIINITDNGFIYLQNLPLDNYTIYLFSNTAGNKTYIVNLNDYGFTILNAYLLSSYNQLLFQFIDASSGDNIENIFTTMTKIINNNYEVVGSVYSDINGNALFNYKPFTKYCFLSTKPGYQDKSFCFNNIIDNTIPVLMKRSATFPNTISDVYVSYIPKNYYCDAFNNFTFQISSGDGLLSSYEYTITYTGGSQTFNGNQPYGEGNTEAPFYINCTNLIDKIQISYEYTTTTGITKSYSDVYYLNDYTPTPFFIADNFTIKANMDRDYNGIGWFEKTLLSTLLILIVVGIVSAIAGGLSGLIAGLIITGILIKMELLHVYSGSMVLIIGILFIVIYYKRGGGT